MQHITYYQGWFSTGAKCDTIPHHISIGQTCICMRVCACVPRKWDTEIHEGACFLSCAPIQWRPDYFWGLETCFRASILLYCIELNSLFLSADIQITNNNNKKKNKHSIFLFPSMKINDNQTISLCELARIHQINYHSMHSIHSAI